MKKKRNDAGFGTIEAVILIAILIGIAIIFREYIMQFVDMIFEKIFKDADKILS
jgi:hypothetical protein